MDMHVPTFAELSAAYCEVAKIERAKNQRPSEGTVMNVLMSGRNILKTCGLSSGDEVTALTRRMLDLYVATARDRGHTRETAWSYVSHFCALTARWALPYYRDMGLEVHRFEVPIGRKIIARYERPAREDLLRVLDWYRWLETWEDKRYWLAATLMLELGMRNGDVGRLKWGNFVEKRVNAGSADEHFETFLCYVPQKTAFSSGRRVNWMVDARTWAAITAARKGIEGVLVVPEARYVFDRLNRELRKLGTFHGQKGCYELRKMCIDHIYQRFGAEAASSISGDDIRTVTRYYADPSAVGVSGVRVVDLI